MTFTCYEEIDDPSAKEIKRNRLIYTLIHLHETEASAVPSWLYQALVELLYGAPWPPYDGLVFTFRVFALLCSTCTLHYNDEQHQQFVSD